MSSPLRPGDRVKVIEGALLAVGVPLRAPFTSRVVAVHGSRVYVAPDPGEPVLDQDGVHYENSPLVVDLAYLELVP